MARCADCNKFVAYGEARVDEIEITLDGESLTLNGTMYLTCEQCSSDIATAELQADENVAEHFPTQPDTEKGDTAEYEMKDEPEAEATDRSQTEAINRKTGKITKIKNSRYAKRFYGVTADCHVTQTIKDKDGTTISSDEATITLGAEEQASGFESIS